MRVCSATTQRRIDRDVDQKLRVRFVVAVVAAVVVAAALSVPLDESTKFSLLDLVVLERTILCYKKSKIESKRE